MKQFFFLSSCLSRIFAVIIFCTSCTLAQQPKQWVTYAGGEGPGKGKHIVLISGDEEYRSEEALPMLGKILSLKCELKCTLLFEKKKKTGT